MFLYVAFLILLFKQPFFFWLMCLRFVGSVPIIHVNRDRKSVDGISKEERIGL